MSELAILVPVLARPHRVEPFLASVNATTEARVLFICDRHDASEREAVTNAKGELLVFDGNYAEKIRAGVLATEEPLIFTGADDLDFQPGWFEAAKAHLRDGVQVVGVNDLVPRHYRQHATHFLMTREYAERPTFDGEPGPFHHGYRHWYCDDELIMTATHRAAYAYAEDAHVEHLHPFASKAPDDATYRLGMENWRNDRRLFRHRARLWT